MMAMTRLHGAVTQTVFERVFASAITAPRRIASASAPCLLASKNKKGKKPGKKRPEKQKLELNPKIFKQEVTTQIIKDPEALGKTSRFHVDESVPLAPVSIQAGPPPSVTGEEFDRLRIRHLRILDLLILTELDTTQKAQLASELDMIESGSLTVNEIKHVLERFLKRKPRMTYNERKALEELVQEDGISREDLNNTIQSRLGEITRARVLKLTELATANGEMWRRSRNTKLCALPKHAEDAWKELNTAIYFSKTFENECTGAGRSMLPAMPEEESVYTGTPLIWDTYFDTFIKKNDVVGYVSFDEHGHVNFVAKRVVAVAGDVVRDNNGNLMKVPAGHFWAEGDNKEESYDSREYGPVPLSNLRFLFDDPLNRVDRTIFGWIGQFFLNLVVKYCNISNGQAQQ